jgi:hypothetical protein
VVDVDDSVRDDQAEPPADHRDLRMWTIYERPMEHPEHFVVRKWRVTKDGPWPSSHVQLASTLDDARAVVPAGLVCLARSGSDDPTVVETWF